jgi:hypothetical protein
MPFFVNAAVLVGLLALIVPPLIHLLSRRRFDVVEWAAMQFLLEAEQTRRRIRFDEWFLMFLRMLVLALLVLGLAAPTLPGTLLDRLGLGGWLTEPLGGPPARRVALVIDGSASLGYTPPGEPPLHEQARAWADEYIRALPSGSVVALVQAQATANVLTERPTADRDQLRSALQRLAPPRGGIDWPGAVQAGLATLTDAPARSATLVVLTDGQRHGWADDATLVRWELLGQGRRDETGRVPIQVIRLPGERPANPGNWSVVPIVASRAVAASQQQLTFRTGVRRTGPMEPLPGKLRVSIDGRPMQEIAPTVPAQNAGVIPVSFTHRFVTPGTHLVSVSLPDDALPADNRQDLAVEVLPALPVLLVDGDERGNPRFRGSDFLRDALAPARDPTPAVLIRVITGAELTTERLSRDIGTTPNTAPRVVVLCDVADLPAENADALERFVGAGGGLLVTHGDRAKAKELTDRWHRGGSGWLPAALVGTIGNANDLPGAVTPDPATFLHPALELFRQQPGDLPAARFPRRWQLRPAASSSTSVVVSFTGQQPWLLEKSFGAGRVLQSAVPFDNGWRTNLTDLSAFAPLVHELVFYLAGARSHEANVQPGQALRYRPAGDVSPGPVTLTPPVGPARTLPVAAWPLVVDDTRLPGVYQLAALGTPTSYFVVQPDPREADLKPWSADEQQRVAALVPGLSYGASELARATDAVRPPTPDQDLGWWLLVGVLLLLAAEVWYTRNLRRKDEG